MYNLISERTFIAQLIELGRRLGWRVGHFRPGQDRRGRWKTAVQGDGAGFPDLVMVRKKRVIFAELKTAKGKVTPAQLDWFYALIEATPEVFIWRPGDIDNIERILK